MEGYPPAQAGALKPLGGLWRVAAREGGLTPMLGPVKDEGTWAVGLGGAACVPFISLTVRHVGQENRPHRTGLW